MSAENPSAALFDLCGGHPALDFVNSLDDRFCADGPRERLVDYEQLLQFARQSALLSVRQARALARSTTVAAAQALRAARELREALAAVLYAGAAGRTPPAPALRILEERWREASRHRELHWQPLAGSARARPRARWAWGSAANQAELPVWMLALAASQLLTSEDFERVRACGSETCRWLFLDTSKNHTRRWCKMKVCGNRMKARRFQARRARRMRTRRRSAA
jgi:predicted RNA-binding Zn ribbon-like protein